MRYLYIIFFLLITGCVHTSFAAGVENIPSMIAIPLQDSLGNARKAEKRAVEQDKKATSNDNALKKVPKAKNKAIPRTIGPTSINLRSPRIAPVKVKVNTQVKIKL